MCRIFYYYYKTCLTEFEFGPVFDGISMQISYQSSFFHFLTFVLRQHLDVLSPYLLFTFAFHRVICQSIFWFRRRTFDYQGSFVGRYAFLNLKIHFSCCCSFLLSLPLSFRGSDDHSNEVFVLVHQLHLCYSVCCFRIFDYCYWNPSKYLYLLAMRHPYRNCRSKFCGIPSYAKVTLYLSRFYFWDLYFT